MPALILAICALCLATIAAHAQTPGIDSYSPDHGHLPGPLVGSWCVRHIVEDRYDLAVEDCQAAIKIDPKSGEPHSNLSAAYLMMRKNEDAIREATEAIRLAPLEATYYFNRGLAHAAKADNERAISDFSVAIGLDPLAPRPYYHRGMALRATGQLDASLRDLKRAEKLADDAIKQKLKSRQNQSTPR